MAIFLDRFTAALAQRPRQGLWHRRRSARTSAATEPELSAGYSTVRFVTVAVKPDAG